MLKFLNINCTFFLKSFSYRRFIKLLSASKFFYDTSLFKFSLKLLQRFFNVFAFFTGTTIILLLLNMLWFKISAVKLRRKITHTFFIHKTFSNYFSKSVYKNTLTSYFRRKVVSLKKLIIPFIYMQQTIKERIRALRMMLKSEAISAFIIPSTDPHLSEYVASSWKTREWISDLQVLPEPLSY